ncbi:MAG TPA: DUF1326 domain-containing protein [Candidatus Acidoferrum sp.]|nr:DUF1326 domain-containing protein [Candidatus Acidoferrum sp.]
MPKSILLFAAILLMFNSLALYPQQVSSTPAVEDFELEGVALFQCQCAAHACPCQKNGAPTHGTCEAADFAHIQRGRYGKIRLDGLNGGSIGNLVDRDSSRLYAAIYVSQEARPEQRDAFAAVLQFLNGAYETSSFKASQVRSVPVTFGESAGKITYTDYKLDIPGILEERAILHRDASGKPLSTVTAMDAWSNTEHYADNVLFRYHDDQVHRAWDHSGGYANIKYFHLTKKMYDDKQMLGQFGDFSGHWTPEQLAILQKQGLPK